MPKKHQAEARTLLSAMPYAETQAACETLRGQFTTRYRKLNQTTRHSYTQAASGESAVSEVSAVLRASTAAVTSGV